MTFDPTPSHEIKIALVQQKLGALRQQHYDAVIESEVIGVQTIESDQKKRRLAELATLASNAARAAEVMQKRLDVLVKESTQAALGEE